MLELPSDLPFDVPGLWHEHRAVLRRKHITVPRVVVHGGYGKNNLGDDAILDVLLKRIIEELYRAEITVVCHGPEAVARRYAEYGVRACHFRSIAALRAIYQSHIYIIGGGGIINRINAYSGRETLPLFDMKGKFLFLAALGAKLAGAQTHFYAIGANSFPDPVVRLLARFVLRSADVVSVRDRASFENLRALGLERRLVQVFDPALSMKPAPVEDGMRLLVRWGYERSARPLVGVGFRYVRDGMTDNRQKVAAVQGLVRHLIDRRGTDVVFFPVSQHPVQHYEDDLHFGRAVLRGLASRRHFTLIEEYAEPRVAMAAFGCADFCVFERLHAVILTTIMDVPVFAVAYDDKVSEFARLIGSTAWCSSDAFLQAGNFGWLDPLLDRALAVQGRSSLASPSPERSGEQLA